ncbi:hypothetical protein LSUB1_G000483 [Lachnellula subtilissima]|uniref:Uncharacterized protein n=1 Tax=Lachnellula subtilissima TaxID=602034 RepID=A0A8H8S3C3_9HELO|nr:hypothetical protein LSUB1_G000483 [Lachnellula subtilissima]
MIFKYIFPASLLATGVLGKAEFVTVTKVQSLVVRDTEPCNATPAGGLPPFCMTDLGTFNPSATYQSTGGTTSSAAIKAPAPSCSLHEADPDEGVDKAFCLCNSSTLPILSVDLATATGPDASCAYTTMPGASATITTNTALGPASTNSALCQVCSLAVVNEDSCTTIPNCLPQAAQASVQAGSSPVHVGTLTGTALYTSVSSALEKLCPPVTQTNSATKCSETDTIKIGNIQAVEDESLTTGELDVTVKSSSYNATSLRDAMIQSAALTFQNSATGKNCYNATYTTEELKKRSNLDWFKESVGLASRDRPYPVQETVQLCNAGDFAGVQYFSQFWRTAPQPGATDYLDANIAFESSGSDFWCEFLADLMDELVVVAPEFAVEDVELGEEIRAICAGDFSTITG